MAYTLSASSLLEYATRVAEERGGSESVSYSCETAVPLGLVSLLFSRTVYSTLCGTVVVMQSCWCLQFPKNHSGGRHAARSVDANPPFVYFKHQSRLAPPSCFPREWHTRRQTGTCSGRPLLWPALSLHLVAPLFRVSRLGPTAPRASELRLDSMSACCGAASGGPRARQTAGCSRG